MTPLPSTLWLQTSLALAVLVVGVLLHLQWHPLRQHLNDALDALMALRWLVPVVAALMLSQQMIHGVVHPPHWPLNVLLSWHDMALPLAAYSAAVFTRLQHGLLPLWPLALLLPLVLSLLVWRVLRLPYRYAARRQMPWGKMLLVIGMMVSWLWVAVETTQLFRGLPEWLETMRISMRTCCMAVMMAASQVALIRLVIGWEQPVEPDDRHDVWLAVEHTLARWRSIAALAALDLLWLLAGAWQPYEPGRLEHWLVLEAQLAFAPLPVAIARVPGSLLGQVAHAMRALLRCVLPLLALGITATAVLSLVHYAAALFENLTSAHVLLSQALRPVHALVLATVHCWVFLAAVLTLLRHGFPPAAPVLGH